MIEQLVAARANAGAWYLSRHDDAPHAVCLRTESAQVTYGEMARLCRQAGAALTERGVGLEDRVLLVLPDSPELVGLIMGAMMIGAVPVPVSTRLTPGEYSYIGEDCRPRIGVVAEDLLDSVAGALAVCTYQPSVCTPGALLDGTQAECHAAMTSRDDAALIQYTSGSTGTPKGVVHLHRGLIALPDGFASTLALTPEDICFSAAKISFGYGAGNSVFFPLATGAQAYLHHGASDPFSVVSILRRVGPTVFFGVPTLYSALLSLPGDTTNGAFSSVRLFISAGEHLNQTLRDRWRSRFGMELVDGLGSTECLHIFMTSVPRPPAGEPGGTLVPGIDARLMDDAGEVLDGSGTGHLWIKSASNAARYWNNHDETMRTMSGPWTRTGDQVFRDDGGYLHYLGRSDDIVKVGGLKVAPSEVESTLMEHPVVAACAVVARTDELGTTAIAAYVKLTDGVDPTPEVERGISRHARANLASHKRPRTYIFVDDLPTTSTGKIARYRLRAQSSA